MTRLRFKASPKARDQHKHAQVRAEQRYGIEFTRRDLENIKEQLADGRARMICRYSLHKTAWSVMVQGKEAYVIYDSRRKQVASFLPLYSREVKNYRRKLQREKYEQEGTR